MCAQSIENFVVSEKLRPGLRVRLTLLWPEISKYRRDGYSLRIIWKYLISENKIPKVSYPWFAALVKKISSESSPTPSTPEASVAPKAVQEKKENEKDPYEPRRSNYVEPKPFRISPIPKDPRELFSKKLAQLAKEEQLQKE